jgi:hypothetical protein
MAYTLTSWRIIAAHTTTESERFARATVESSSSSNAEEDHTEEERSREIKNNRRETTTLCQDPLPKTCIQQKFLLPSGIESEIKRRRKKSIYPHRPRLQ